MFNLFKKKSDLEKLIAKEGFEKTTAGFARVISRQLSTHEIAHQFMLEELEAASMGNAEAQAFVRKSGVSASDYAGSMNNSRPEVDAAGGPQQTVIGLCMQLRANADLMVKFRIGILDKIMREYKFGKYVVEGGVRKDVVAVDTKSGSRIAQIAVHVVDLSENNMQLVGLTIDCESAERLVRECADGIRDDVFKNYDTKIVGMAVMQMIARNGVQFGETEKKSACMLAMSVIWAAKKLEEDGYPLSDEERNAVVSLETDARALLNKHYAVVDVLQAKLWIATTLTSEPARLVTVTV